MAEQLIRALCAERGIKIARRGLAYVLIGPGVSILVSSLAVLQEKDLRPVFQNQSHDATSFTADLH